jgi:Fur family zinc uptake transcriptional regulator
VLLTESSGSAQAFAGGRHDHARCVDTAIEAAAELCTARAVRLTSLRRRVLELVWRSHRPIGAYEILDVLRADGRSAAPPTVYRALEFLLEQGLVHRIESRNAFIGCIDPRAPHSGQFLICGRCGDAVELHDHRISAVLRRSAERVGFRVEGQTVEIRGLCPRCGVTGEGSIDGG